MLSSIIHIIVIFIYLCELGAGTLRFVTMTCTGDGGNDVSMIQAADVGVGILGKVSDF